MEKEKGLFPRGSRKKDLLEKVGTLKLQKEKCSDQHIKTGSLSTSRPFRNYQKPWPGRKPDEGEELVKHMSHVPSYLQQNKREHNFQEKALTVGVLDWGLLEKWAYQQECATTGCDRASTSTSSPSLFPFSALSAQSSTNILDVLKEKKSPAKKPLSAIEHRHPAKERSGDVNSFHRSKTCTAELPTCCDKDSDTMPCLRSEALGQKKNMDKQKDSEADSSLAVLEKNKAISMKNYRTEDKHCRSYRTQKIRHNRHCMQLSSNIERCAKYCEGTIHGCQKEKAYRRIDSEQESAEGILVSCDLSPAETGRKLSSKKQEVDVFFVDSSYIPRSCPLPCTFPCEESDEAGITINSASLNAESLSQDPKIYNKKDLGSCKQFVMGKIRKSVQSENSETSGCGTEMANHLLNVGPKQMARSASLKEKPSSDNLKTNYYVFLPKASGDQGSNSNKSRRSPLRRILDPFLKPKDDGSNCSTPVAVLPKRRSYEPSKSDRTLICEEIELSFGKRKSSHMTADSINQTVINISGQNEDSSQQDTRNVAPTKQALLEISWKNGLPSFRLSSSDNELLAATTSKNLVKSDDDLECLYTIFSLDKSKKKGMLWGNHGSNRKNHHFFSSIVGHLKVSRPSSNYDANVCQICREFVLFGAELVQTQQNLVDAASSNELAAFIINVQKETSDGSAVTTLGCNFRKAPSVKQPKISITCARQESHHSILSNCNKSASGFVAILPKEVHSLITEGKPSPLIERWKSGGVCDCGGWDEGCRLTVLCDKLQDHTDYSAQDSNQKFQLFIQGASHDKIHAFRMMSVKEGLYAVEFRSSIAFVQAFAICIANIHTRKVHGNSGRQESLHEQLLSSDEGKTAFDILQRCPESYKRYRPPLSPVGRA